VSDDRVPGDGDVLLVSRFWPAVLVPAGVLAAAVVTGVWLLDSVPFVPAALLLTTVIVGWLHRGNELLADETGLLVRRRGRITRHHRWEEIHQAGLTRPGFGQVALAVYPDGGPWDVPGPNSAVLVGRVWMLRMPDRKAQDRIHDLLRARGVRVTEEFRAR
jgi:hypothetical protein